MNGLFIAVEGLDCSGKTTIVVPHLKEYLVRHNRPVTAVRDLNEGKWQQKIRSLHLSSPDQEGDPKVLLLSASRCQLVEDYIQPALDRKDMVISDRYCATTYAYRDDSKNILKILPMGTKGVEPEITLFLTIPYSEFWARLQARGDEPIQYTENISPERYRAREGRYRDYLRHHQYGHVIELNTALPSDVLDAKLDLLAKLLMEYKSHRDVTQLQEHFPFN